MRGARVQLTPPPSSLQLFMYSWPLLAFLMVNSEFHISVNVLQKQMQEKYW